MSTVIEHVEEPVQMQTQNIIIIHPGSLYVKIGRASDLNPCTELHAVARKRLPGGLVHRDPILPPLIPKLKDLEAERDACRLQVSHTLGSCLMSNNQRRYVTPPQQISAFNKRVIPEVVAEIGASWVKSEENVVFGDSVLHLNPALDFNVHFPMKRGDLNRHSGVGGSLTGVLADLQAIWSWVISVRLGIPLQDLKNYRAVLVIPDIYNRQYLKEYVTLLLDMGFSSCFLLQDHVAATFGCGVGTACVVDCGHSKTSVSCVEDGISHPATRVRLPYGGGDITQCFYWLLKKCGFPYQADPDSFHDNMLLDKLKQDACHIELDICGCKELTFTVNKPDSPVYKYTIQSGDEAIIAPLSLFYPELLILTGPKQISTQGANTGDSTDPHDADYLRETGRKKECEVEADEELAEVEASGSGEFCTNEGGLLPLDQAILQSIQKCGSDDLKRKMYSSILLIGGGLKFKGIISWLEKRLSQQIPIPPKDDGERSVMEGKDAAAVWKGAAILACLESAGELWISKDEWLRFGIKLIRERGPFLW
ncbi:unnamed protein product [Nezara viridula]|uniref:Actin-related protein 8 n=1 Tax=Nezara viridula TaxID=85310 RepID=A0A9P0ECP5_NEZVI|nr:unnamed protein product [Nezara viridula]